MSSLSGIRVVEVASFIAGPLAGQMLADFGADVIKVEPPGGDPFRGFNTGGYGMHFVAYNRNKRSIVVDQHSPEAPAIMRALLERADVFLENSRPGVWERLGLGYQTVREWNPRLIYCSVTGFGQTGPLARRPAFDGVGQGLSGMASQLMDAQRPGIIGPAFSDCITGMTASNAILAAWVSRASTGRGQHVDVSMLASTASFLNSEISAYFQSGDVGGPRKRAELSQSFAFACADGKALTVHLSAVDKFWEALVHAVERPDLAQDERFRIRPRRVEHFELLEDLLAIEFAKRPRAEWERLLEQHDVPYAPVYGFDEVFASPQAQHLGLELRLSHPTEGEVGTIAPAPRFSDTPWGDLRPPPTLGQHTAEILAEIGLSRRR